MRPCIYVERRDCSPTAPWSSTTVSLSNFTTESENEHIVITTTEHQDSTTILGGTNPPKDAPGMDYTWTIGTPRISYVFAPIHFTIKLFFDGHVEIHDLVTNVTQQDNDSYQSWELSPPPEFTPPDSSFCPLLHLLPIPSPRLSPRPLSLCRTTQKEIGKEGKIKKQTRKKKTKKENNWFHIPLPLCVTKLNYKS
jgi:hypothetical protein